MPQNPNKFSRPMDEQIKIVDSLTPSPEQRALRVHRVINPYIEDFSNWDMICYCLHFLNSQAVGYEWLLTPIKIVNRMIYNAHYYFADDLGLLNETSTDRKSISDDSKNVSGG